jgi:porphobilinogen synthase
MSYSAKFKSTFYKGWREAVKIKKGIVRDYQLDVHDREGAIRRSKQYALDGADYCMVKPGMPCLDLIEPIKRATGKPTGAFQTSGEWIAIDNDPGTMRECADIFKRAGADYLISYGARLL